MADICPQCVSFRMRRPVTIVYTPRAQRKVAALRRLGLSLHTKALQRALYLARGRAANNEGYITLGIAPGIHLSVRFIGPKYQTARVLDLTLAPALAKTRGPRRERRSIGVLFRLMLSGRPRPARPARPAAPCRCARGGAACSMCSRRPSAPSLA
jgi:hypothetical protein